MADDETEDVLFHEWMRDHRGGDLSEEMQAAVAEVLQAVTLTGKKGSVSLTINIEAKGRSVLVLDKVDTKVPKPDREAAIYFSDGNGNLVREDPVQMKLQLEQVQRDNGDLAQADRRTGELVSLPTGKAVNDGAHVDDAVADDDTNPGDEQP